MSSSRGAGSNGRTGKGFLRRQRSGNCDWEKFWERQQVTRQSAGPAFLARVSCLAHLSARDGFPAQLKGGTMVRVRRKANKPFSHANSRGWTVLDRSSTSNLDDPCDSGGQLHWHRGCQKRPMQAWVSCSRGRTTACGPKPWVALGVVSRKDQTLSIVHQTLSAIHRNARRRV